MRIVLGDCQDNIELEKSVSIYDVKKLIVDRKNIPLDEIHILKYDNIYYQNKDLVDNNSVLQVKKMKNRCPICIGKSATIIGYCKFCCLNYCASHRLPETHQCPNMADCKKQSFAENSQRVMSQKCVALKI